LSAEIRFIGVRPNEGTVHMIVIGTDTHKGSHALAAVDEGTGRVRGQREIKADEPGHLAAVKWARGLDGGCFTKPFRLGRLTQFLHGAELH
jgi:hypothetical protein